MKVPSLSGKTLGIANARTEGHRRRDATIIAIPVTVACRARRNHTHLSLMVFSQGQTLTTGQTYHVRGHGRSRGRFQCRYLLPLMAFIIARASNTAATAATSHSGAFFSYFQDLEERARSAGTLFSSVTSFKSGVIQVKDDEGSDGEAATYRLCPLTSILPYTSTIDTRTPTSSANRALEPEVGQEKQHKHRPGVISDTASILVAQHIWNTEMALSSDFSPPCNIRFTNTFFDTQSSPIRATAYLSNVFRGKHKPCAVLGPFTSTETIPTAILSGVYNTPQIGYGLASSVDLSDHEQYPYYHRIMASTDVEAKAILEYVVTYLDQTEDGVHHICLIHSTDSYGSSLAKSVTDLIASSPSASPFSSSNMEVIKVPISFEAHLLSEKQGIANSIRRLKSTGYKYILCAVSEEQYKFVMEEAYTQGMAGGDTDIFWMITGMDESSLQQQLVSSEQQTPSQADNVTTLVQASLGVGLFQWKPAPPNTSDDVSVPPGYDFFRDAYKRYLGDPYFEAFVLRSLPPNVGVLLEQGSSNRTSLSLFYGDEPSRYGYALYDAVMTLGRAACQASISLSDAVGSTSSDSYLLEGPELSAAISEVAFDNGASGPVSFDASTRTRRNNTYGMYNLLLSPPPNEGNRGTKRMHTSSTTRSSSLIIQLSAEYSETTQKWVERTHFMYPSGSTEVPPALPPVDYYDPHYIGQAARITGWVLCGLVMFLALLCSAWTLYQRTRVPVIDASGETFLHLTVVGCIVMASSIIPLGMEEPVVDDTHDGLNKACEAAPWLYYTGFAMISSGMLAKTWFLYTIAKRKKVMNQITNQDTDKRKKSWNSATPQSSVAEKMININASRLCLAFGVCFSVTFFMLLTQQLVAPLQWERVSRLIFDKYNRSLQSYGTCTSDNGALEETTRAVIFGWNALLLLGGNIAAFWSRSVRTEYKESHYISLILASILQSLLISVPIMIVVRASPIARFFVNTVSVVVITCSTLGLLFIPKYLAVRQLREESEKLKASFALMQKEGNESRDTNVLAAMYNAQGPQYGRDSEHMRHSVGSLRVRSSRNLRSSLCGAGSRSSLDECDIVSNCSGGGRGGSTPGKIRGSQCSVNTRSFGTGPDEQVKTDPAVRALQAQIELLRECNNLLAVRNEGLHQKINARKAPITAVAAANEEAAPPHQPPQS
jgi:hypothetical protein